MVDWREGYLWGADAEYWDAIWVPAVGTFEYFDAVQYCVIRANGKYYASLLHARNTKGNDIGPFVEKDEAISVANVLNMMEGGVE